MGCNCGKRRSYEAMTSANLPQPITPEQSSANAIANARGMDDEVDEPASAGQPTSA